MTTLELDLPAMRSSAADAARFLRLIANEDRLLLLCQLTDGERCVSELEQETGITQPTLSQQLGILRHDGLVVTRRDGKFIFYALGDQRVVSMLGTLHGIFCKTQSKTITKGTRKSK